MSINFAEIDPLVCSRAVSRIVLSLQKNLDSLNKFPG